MDAIGDFAVVGNQLYFMGELLGSEVIFKQTMLVYQKEGVVSWTLFYF